MAGIARVSQSNLISKKNRAPVILVLGAKRFNDILTRSQRNENLAAIEEEKRNYMKYLKDGNDALCERFTNIRPWTEVDEWNNKMEQYHKEDEMWSKQLVVEKDLLRKQRIARASKMLKNLRPAQQALHSAMLMSEVLHQRKYNEALNREIAEDAARQERLDVQQCPAVLIPFTTITEEQVKAQELEKVIAIQKDLIKNIEEKRQQKLEERKQEIYEGILEREHCKCLHEQELKAAKEIAERKCELCRRSYEDNLIKKAERKKYESICEEIEDRKICVDVVKQRTLANRFSQQRKEIFEKRIQDREALALAQFAVEKEKQQKAQAHQDKVEAKYEALNEMELEKDQLKIKELSKQLRAFELEARKSAEEKRQRAAEIRRFEMARRYKNQEANNLFNDSEKRREAEIKTELRYILHAQREEFLQQRQDELMRLTACGEDPFLEQDVLFFRTALKMILEAREKGRPIYPIAKQVELYRRQNQIDMDPEGRIVRRNKLRDYCWPGYFAKAELAYRKYEHREECKLQQVKERHDIFTNCIKITKIASEDKPHKPCTPECPYKDCVHQDDDIVDCPGDACKPNEKPILSDSSRVEDKQIIDGNLPIHLQENTQPKPEQKHNQTTGLQTKTPETWSFESTKDPPTQDILSPNTSKKAFNESQIASVPNRLGAGNNANRSRRTSSTKLPFQTRAWALESLMNPVGK